MLSLRFMILAVVVLVLLPIGCAIIGPDVVADVAVLGLVLVGLSWYLIAQTNRKLMKSRRKSYGYGGSPDPDDGSNWDCDFDSDQGNCILSKQHLEQVVLTPAGFETFRFDPTFGRRLLPQQVQCKVP